MSTPYSIPHSPAASARIATTKYTLSSPPTGEFFEFATSARGADGLFRFVWTLAPGKTGPSSHHHETETETFAIVSGSIRITVDGVVGVYGPGDVVVIPPKAVHSFLNPGTDPVVINVTFDGPLMEDAFVPIAVASFGRAFRVSDLLTMFCGFVEPFPSTPASSLERTLMVGLVKLLGLLGFRRLPPVHNWTHPAQPT